MTVALAQTQFRRGFSVHDGRNTHHPPTTLTPSRLLSSHPELPRVESAAMRTRIYPWIILTIVLSIVILYTPSDLYKYARKETRTAIVKLQLKLDRMRMRYEPPAAL